MQILSEEVAEILTDDRSLCRSYRNPLTTGEVGDTSRRIS